MEGTGEIRRRTRIRTSGRSAERERFVRFARETASNSQQSYFAQVRVRGAAPQKSGRAELLLFMCERGNAPFRLSIDYAIKRSS